MSYWPSEYDPHQEVHEDIEPEEHEGLPDHIDLGGGMKLVISPDAFRTIMHTPEITALVEERCQNICDAANSAAVKDGAEYVYFVSNNQNNIRARGRVKAANIAAKVDDQEHATLLKALEEYPSDPKPDGTTTSSLTADSGTFYEDGREGENEPGEEEGGEE